MFGGSGFDASGTEIFFNDLWEFASGKWARLSDGAHVKGVAWPRARRAHTGVLFDDDTMVVFGGKDDRGVTLSDAWAYSLSQKTFSQIDAPFPSRPRKGHSAVMISGAMVVFGGRENAKKYFNDVLALRKNDHGAYTWKMLHSGNGSNAPAKRNHHAAAAVLGSMVVFGGRTSHGYAVNSIKSDLWSFDMSSGTWTEIRKGDDASTLWPMGRFEHMMEYAGNGLVLVIAGQGVDGDRRNDVWSYSATMGTWVEASPNDCAARILARNNRTIYAISGVACSIGALLLFVHFLKVTSMRRGYTSL